MRKLRIRPNTGRGRYRNRKNTISDKIYSLLASDPCCAGCKCGLDPQTALLAFPNRLSCDACYPQLHQPPADHEQYRRQKRLSNGQTAEKPKQWRR